MYMYVLQENDQRRQLEEKRKKREEAKKAADEAKRKKLAAKGQAPADEPEEPTEETCVIDNLLKEIRAGTTLRRTGQNSVHKRRRRTSQLKKAELERLNQIVEKSTASPRKSPTSVTGYESQFKFPVVDEENENEGETSKTNGVEIPNGSAKVSNDGTKETPDKGQGLNNSIDKKAGSNDAVLNGQGINGETDVAPLPNGENYTILKPEAKIDRQGRDLSVSQPQRLTSPAVGDTATNSQSLPVSPAKDRLPQEEGSPVLERVTQGPHRETKSPEKEGTEKEDARSPDTQSKEKEGTGSLEKKELEKQNTQSKEKEGTGSVEKKDAKSLEKQHTQSNEKEGTGPQEKKSARSLEKQHTQSKGKEEKGTGSVEKKGARSLRKKHTQSKEEKGTRSLEKKGARSLRIKSTETKEKKGKKSRGKDEMGSVDKETGSVEKDGSRTSSDTSLNLTVSYIYIIQ